MTQRSKPVLSDFLQSILDLLAKPPDDALRVNHQFIGEVAKSRRPDAVATVRQFHEKHYDEGPGSELPVLAQTRESLVRHARDAGAERDELARRLDAAARFMTTYTKRFGWAKFDLVKLFVLVLGAVALVRTSFVVQTRLLEESGMFPAGHGGFSDASSVSLLLICGFLLIEILHWMRADERERVKHHRHLSRVALFCSISAGICCIAGFGAGQSVEAAALGDGAAQAAIYKRLVFLLLCIGEPCAAASMFIAAERSIRAHRATEHEQRGDYSQLEAFYLSAKAEADEAQRLIGLLDGRVKTHGLRRTRWADAAEAALHVEIAQDNSTTALLTALRGLMSPDDALALIRKILAQPVQNDTLWTPHRRMAS